MSPLTSKLNGRRSAAKNDTMWSGLRKSFAISAHCIGNARHRAPYSRARRSAVIVAPNRFSFPSLYANVVHLLKASSVFRGRDYLLIRNDLIRILDDEKFPIKNGFNTYFLKEHSLTTDRSPRRERLDRESSIAYDGACFITNIWRTSA